MKRKFSSSLTVRKLICLGLVIGMFCSLPLLSSCAGPSPTSTVPSTTASSPSQSPSPSPTQTIEKIIRQTQASASAIDPAVGSDFVSSLALANLYDTLVFPNIDGTVRPWAANSWDISEDGLIYTFSLKPGIKFHNGDELTAEDVAFSMDRIMAIGEGYAYLFTTTVSEVKTLDNSKVQFILKKPFGPFINALVRLYILNEKQVKANIDPSGTYGAMGDYGKNWLVTNDAGSGPYQVKEMKPMESLYAVRFSDYWQPFDENAPDSFKEIGTTEAVTVRTLLARRELEISDQWQTTEALVGLDAIAGVDIASYFAGSVLNIMLHTKKPPTDDIHFRKALAYCLDYKTICDQLFPGARQAVGPVCADTPGHDPNLFQFTQDLVKAEAELKQSKYYGQLDQYPVELHWVAEVPDEEKIALMLQSNAQKIGINVEVVKIPWLTCIENMTTPETTPNATIVFVAPSYAEAGSLLESRYHSKSTGTWEQGEWLQDPQIDSMIEDAISTIDRTERFNKYYLLQEKIVELCPTIWIYDQPEKAAYQTDYVYWPAAADAKNGKPVNPVMGYNFYFPEFRVYPDKIPNP